MKNWEEAFAPVMAQGRELREGQSLLGQAVIEAIETKTSLIAEASTGTGKSFASLIPIICKIIEQKKLKKSYRGVVSTETLTLQTQLVEKDLPFLSNLYGGFTYSKLMGRSNYICFNAAKLATKGNNYANGLYNQLLKYRGNLGTGELADAERVLKIELDPDLWGFLSGSATFCGDNQCDSEECYSTKAREKALTSDLVVINHALLSVDNEMKGGDQFADGMLGPINTLVIDEGHQLEPVLVSQNTKSLSDWELQDMGGSILVGIDTGRAVYNDTEIGDDAAIAIDLLQSVMTNILNYYHRYNLHYGTDWKGSETALCTKTINFGAPGELLNLMEEFEEKNPGRIQRALDIFEKVNKYFDKARAAQAEVSAKGVTRKLNKGARAASELTEIVKIIQQAIETSDGIVNSYGTYGAIVDGWYRKSGEKGMTLRLVPLDVSKKAAGIFSRINTNILLSATLTDLTDGTFNYARTCLSFPEGKEIKVGTPFDLQNKQLVYISPAQQPVVELNGARFSFTELVSLLNASKGRALVLFTSRVELEWVADALKSMRATGEFPYNVYVQDRDVNKSRLMASFKEDTHSVLLATKSFFVGVDIPGESLSLLALVKYPLPRFSAECKQQITHWRKRGFSRWYERESLTVFQQAAGRLIRSSGCKGVVALLDQRAYDTGTSVYKTAKIGVNALGSPVTLNVNDVENFLR